MIPFLEDSIELITEVIDRFGDSVALACSYGKDSMSVLDLALKVDPNIKVIHYLAAPFKETTRFRKKMEKRLDLNTIILRPYKNMGYWECVEKYGLPGIRTSEKGKRHSPKCCYYMKEKPMKIFIKKNDIKAVITGISSEESWNRKKTAYRYNTGTWRGGLKPESIDRLSKYQEDEGWGFCGMRYFAMYWDSWQVHPLMNWTEKDVWKYTNENKVPINPVYNKWGGIYKRVGCLPCTAYLSWEKNLSISHPNLYKRLKQIQTGEGF